MGNIEPWMTFSFLSNILKEVNIFPKNIILKNPSNRRGCAFLEFNSKEEAETTLKNINGKIIHNLELKFNWVRTLEEKYLAQKIKKFTVSYIFK
jgi:RNA recognition motif-containing protein